MYPLFDQMMDQKILRKNQFGFYLSNQVDKPGKLVLGEEGAKQYYKGELAAHDVIEDNYWAVRLVDVEVDNKRLHVCEGSGCKLAVDSGTSLLTGPTRDISNMLAKLNIDQDCANWDRIPHISLLLEAARADGSKYIKRYPLNKQEYVFEAKDESGQRKSCTPGLMALDVPQPRGPLWIVGDLFMMKYFTMYSRDTNQVLMGEAKHENGMQLFTNALVQESESSPTPKQSSSDQRLGEVVQLESDEQNTDDTLSGFEPIPNYESTEGEFDRRTDVSRSGCASLCASQAACKAFQINTHKRVCVLMDKQIQYARDFEYYAKDLALKDAQVEDGIAAQVSKRRAAEKLANEKTKELDALKAKHEAVAQAQFESSSILHTAESDLLKAKHKARMIVANAKAEASHNMEAAKQLAEAIEGKQQSDESGIAASRAALTLLEKAEQSASQKAVSTVAAFQDAGLDLFAYQKDIVAEQNNENENEITEVKKRYAAKSKKLNSAKADWQAAMSSLTKGVEELATARQTFLEQLTAYIDEKQKASDILTTEAAVNAKENQRVKSELEKRESENEAKFAEMAKKQAADLAMSQQIRKAAIAERQEAADIRAQAVKDALAASTAKNEALKEASSIKDKATDQGEEITKQAEREAEKQHRKAQEMKAHAMEQQQNMEQSAKVLDASLHQKAQQFAEKEVATVKRNAEKEAEAAKDVEAVEKSAADQFKLNILIKAKSASDALLQKVQAQAALKQSLTAVRELKQTMEQKEQSLESEIAASSSADVADKIRQEFEANKARLQGQLDAAEKEASQAAQVLNQANFRAQSALIESGVCSYSTESARKALDNSKTACLSDCRQITASDGSKKSRLGCDETSCNFLCEE
jgi:hypothetical protein